MRVIEPFIKHGVIKRSARYADTRLAQGAPECWSQNIEKWENAA